MNDLRKLPLHTYHLGNAARFTSFAGWQMPISYGSSLDEHMATRKEYSFFDVSHMGEIEVSGAEATDFLNFVITNDIRKCKDGQAIYSPLCYRNGGTVDDLIVYKVSHQNYLLCVNASNISKDLDFLEEHKGSFNCEVMDRSFHFSQLALQGPRSFELMSKFFGTRIVNIDKMHFKQFNLGDIPILLARTGYTGEDGFEIYVPEKKITDLVAYFEKANAPEKLSWAGITARDSLRLEAGFALYGNELSEEISPIQAGLSWTVSFDKGEFLSRSALFKDKGKISRGRVLHFEVHSRRIPRSGARLYFSGKEAGKVLSGGFSPIADCPVGSAWLNAEFCGYSNMSNWEADVRGKKVPIKICKPVLCKRN